MTNKLSEKLQTKTEDGRGKMESKQSTPNEGLFHSKILRAMALFVLLIAAVLGRGVGKLISESYFVPSPALQNVAQPISPELAAIQEYYPAQYSQIMSTAPHTIDPIAMHNAVEPIIIKILADHRNQISDDNLEKSYSVFVSEAKILREKNPASCISLINGTSVPINLNSVYPSDIIQEDKQTTTADLIQIATQPAGPATPLSDDQFTTLVENAFNALPLNEQAVAKPLIEKGENPESVDEDRSFCDLQINVFLNALSGPKGTLKSLLARNS